MKIVRCIAGGSIIYGVLSDGIVTRIELDDVKIPRGNVNAYPLEEVTMLPPAAPAKIVAVGLNYKEHSKELGLSLPDEPLLFMKPSSSIISTGENIIYPDMSEQVDYEGELGIVMKGWTKDVTPEEAKGCILGYVCVNDVTARDLQRKDVQFTRAKSFDTFCPIGPCIQTELDPMNAQIRTYVNGALRQDSNTSDMIFDVYYLVSFISRIMTLEAGDVITTGTPQGVGSLNRGDEVVVEIEGIGRLTNKII